MKSLARQILEQNAPDMAQITGQVVSGMIDALMHFRIPQYGKSLEDMGYVDEDLSEDKGGFPTIQFDAKNFILTLEKQGMDVRDIVLASSYGYRDLGFDFVASRNGEDSFASKEDFGNWGLELDKVSKAFKPIYPIINPDDTWRV